MKFIPILIIVPILIFFLYSCGSTESLTAGNEKLDETFELLSISPENSSSNLPLSVVLSWNFKSTYDSLSFDLYFGTSPDNLKLQISNLNKSECSVDNLSPMTEYYWKFIAKHGESIVFESPVYHFKTMRMENRNPEIVILNPKRNMEFEGREIKVEWEATDPNGDALRFDLYVGNTPSSLEPVATNLATNSYVLKLEPGLYYFKIVAKDGKGGITQSEVLSFRMVGRIIKYIFPEEGSRVSDYTVKLKWNLIGVENKDDYVYDLYIGEDSTPILHVSGLMTSEFEVHGIVPGKEYKWYVVARSKDGNDRIKGDVSHFESLGTPPKKIRLLEPLLLSLKVPVRDIVFKWEKVDGAKSYDFYFDIFPNPRLYKSDVGVECFDFNYENKYVCGFVHHDRVWHEYWTHALWWNDQYQRSAYGNFYYWKVIAKDANGNVIAESPIWSFRTGYNVSPRIVSYDPPSAYHSDDTVYIKIRLHDDNNDMWRPRMCPNALRLYYYNVAGSRVPLNFHGFQRLWNCSDCRYTFTVNIANPPIPGTTVYWEMDVEDEGVKEGIPGYTIVTGSFVW